MLLIINVLVASSDLTIQSKFITKYGWPIVFGVFFEDVFYIMYKDKEERRIIAHVLSIFFAWRLNLRLV